MTRAVREARAFDRRSRAVGGCVLFAGMGLIEDTYIGPQFFR